MGTSVIRTFDSVVVLEATDQCRDSLYHIDFPEWLSNEDNVALTNHNDDVALFQRERPGCVTGHYFFFCRGKEALRTAKEMLSEAFTGDYDIEVIRGLVPLGHLGSRWMTRKLGFTSYGVVFDLSGPCELFILTKNEWEANG